MILIKLTSQLCLPQGCIVNYAMMRCIHSNRAQQLEVSLVGAAVSCATRLYADHIQLDSNEQHGVFVF